MDSRDAVFYNAPVPSTIKKYIKQIKIFDNEPACNRWLRDKEPELIIDIKIQSNSPYNDRVIMVIYMEEI